MLQELSSIDDFLNEHNTEFDDSMMEDPSILVDDTSGDTGMEPLISIDLDEVDESAQTRASIITERLSNYYFDEKYIKEHPYIPTKIMMEMDNIRRLLKMLMVNEKAQDALIKAIALAPGKGTLFISLTSMQKGTLLIQKQLNDVVTGIEQIFQRMQDEADKQWSEKDKDEGDDGTMTVRGSREFIKQLQNQMLKHSKKGVAQTAQPSEDINDDGTPTGATPISDIIG